MRTLKLQVMIRVHNGQCLQKCQLPINDGFIERDPKQELGRLIHEALENAWLNGCDAFSFPPERILIAALARCNGSGLEKATTNLIAAAEREAKRLFSKDE